MQRVNQPFDAINTMTALIGGLELTKQSTPVVSFLQTSVTYLSCSLASFMYADHILSIESSWAVAGVVRRFDMLYITTYPR